MTDASWQDRVVGARMAVDTDFEDRVAASSFSRQQWSLIMTATEFELVDAEDPERARIVADTDELETVLPELDRIEAQMGAMGGGTGGDSDSGGLFESIANALGFGNGDEGDGEAAQREEATELVSAYADRLQAHLEDEGRWEEIRSLAAGE